MVVLSQPKDSVSYRGMSEGRWPFHFLIAQGGWGSGSSTAVEHTPQHREVMGSNTAGCWAFFIFSIPSVVRPYFSSLEEVEHF